jgi:TonB dependent receptor
LPARREKPLGCGEPADDIDVLGDRGVLGGRRPTRGDECALGQDLLDERSPLSLGPWLDASTLERLPGADALHDSQAAFALGVGRDEGGVVIGGASSYENRWTLEGAPVDSPRLGAAETRLPLPFLSGIRVTTGGFSARDRASSGGVIDAELIRGGAEHVVRAHAWAGAQATRRERPVPPGTYSVLRGRFVDPAFASAAVVASGPLEPVSARLGGRAWYAVGVAPSLTDISFERDGLRLVDRDADGQPDLDANGGFVTEPITRSTVDATARSIPVLARAGLERPEQSVELSLLGQWSTGARVLGVATSEASLIERDNLLLDGIATWRRRWGHTSLRAQVAWHHGAREESPATAAGEAVQFQTAFVPSLAEVPTLDPRIATACRDDQDGDDFYPLIPNCPVLTGWFFHGGVGVLNDVTTDRPSFSVDLAHKLGGHALRGGFLGEDARMVVDTRYTGGSLERSLFEGHREVVKLVDGAAEDVERCTLDIDVACPTADRVSLAFRTRHLGAYLEDTFRPHPDLLVDVGVRWEYQQLGSRIKIDDNFAPRAGVAWDPLGAGRSRVAATFARTFTYLPAGLGELVDKAVASVRDISFMEARSRVVETGGVTSVRSGTRPMTTDEVAFSAEVMWPRLGRLRLLSQHRWLREGLEDNAAGFGNPQSASRRTDILGAELATSVLAELSVRVGYAWGQTRGSLVGAFDPRRGNILYNSSDFDEVVANGAGTLPSDLGHRFYADLAKQRRFGKKLAVEGGARLNLSSGRPQSLIADSGLWGNIYLLPRGSAQRLPAIVTTDVRLAARWGQTSLSLQVQNLFSRETVTATDEIYARGLFSPIDGGDASDLPFLKSVNGNPARRAPAYGTPTNYQLPIVAVLGVESSF